MKHADESTKIEKIETIDFEIGSRYDKWRNVIWFGNTDRHILYLLVDQKLVVENRLEDL